MFFNKKNSAFGFIVLLISILTSQIAYSDNALERSFVPKSKLVDALWAKHDPSSTTIVEHSAWDHFLSKYIVKNGSINLVAYGKVTREDKEKLSTYLDDLQKIDVTLLNRDEQFSFWLNLYNASTVFIILKHYPVKSVREIKNGVLDFHGPFNDIIAKVNGKNLSLNTIESGIVRPIWKDPRLHYAFNCAAITCPNLNNQAYNGKTLDNQLNAAAHSYINDKRGIHFEGKKVIASKIFFWYEGDFGGSEKAILNHMKKFAEPTLKARLQKIKRIDDYVYDWSLNESPQSKS